MNQMEAHQIQNRGAGGWVADAQKTAISNVSFLSWIVCWRVCTGSLYISCTSKIFYKRLKLSCYLNKKLKTLSRNDSLCQDLLCTCCGQVSAIGISFLWEMKRYKIRTWTLKRNRLKYLNNSDTCPVSYVPGKQCKHRAIDIKQDVVFLVRKGFMEQLSIHLGFGDENILHGNGWVWEWFQNRFKIAFAFTRECICQNICKGILSKTVAWNTSGKHHFIL